MKYYDSDMQQFLQKTTVVDFIPYCKGLRRFEKVPERFIEVKAVIDKRDYTIGIGRIEASSYFRLPTTDFRSYPV